MDYDPRDVWLGSEPGCAEAFDEFERRASGLLIPDTAHRVYNCWRGLLVQGGCRRWHDSHRIYDDGDYRWSDLTLVRRLRMNIDHARAWALRGSWHRVLINQPYADGRTYLEPTEGVIPRDLLVWDAPIESWWAPDGGTILQVIAAPSVMPKIVEMLS